MGFAGGCLTVFAVVFVIGWITSQMGTHGTSTDHSTRGNDPAPPPNTKLVAMSNVKLDFTWSKGGFDNIMEANFTVHNNSEYDIKDFEITCTHSASSGTVIDHNVRTIYDVVKANSKRRFPKFSMGFIHTQATRSGCAITDLKVVQ